MSVRIDPKLLTNQAELVPPPLQRACEDHDFELPTGIYVALATLLFGFLAVLAVGLPTPGLVVPMAINFLFLTAFFAVPTLFVASSPRTERRKRWSEFLEKGVDTATGHSSGKEAAVLILMLPAFIFGWAVAVVAINAAV